MLLNCGVGEDPWEPFGRSNQSILKEISPGCSLEGLMLKLKLHYLGHLMWRDSFEKTLMLGKIQGRRRGGWQTMRWLDGVTDSMDMGLGGLQELVMDRKAWHAVVHVVTKSWTWLSDWTESGHKKSVASWALFLPHKIPHLRGNNLYAVASLRESPWRGTDGSSQQLMLVSFLKIN